MESRTSFNERETARESERKRERERESQNRERERAHLVAGSDAERRGGVGRSLNTQTMRTCQVIQNSTGVDMSGKSHLVQRGTDSERVKEGGRVRGSERDSHNRERESARAKIERERARTS